MPIQAPADAMCATKTPLRAAQKDFDGARSADIGFSFHQVAFDVVASSGGEASTER
jgi:hypothetical protein